MNDALSLDAPSLAIQASRALDARLHRPRAWTRDLALIGAASALPLAPAGLPWSFTLLSALVAAAGGALIGLTAPLLLHRRVRRVPLVLLMPAAFGLGGLWGSVTGVVVAALTSASWTATVPLFATAGALQLGWSWIPYCIGLARFRTTWPIVLAACALAPLVGWMAFVHVTS